MNKIKIIIFLIALLQISCSSAQKISHQSKSQEGYFITNKNIDWKEDAGNYYVNIVKGDQLVFSVISKSGGDPRNDTQIKTTIIFAIASDKKSFQLDETWFDKNPAFLLRSCRCIDAGYNKIIRGSMSGRLLKDDSWDLKIEIEAEGNDSKNLYTFSFNGTVKEDSR